MENLILSQGQSSSRTFPISFRQPSSDTGSANIQTLQGTLVSWIGVSIVNEIQLVPSGWQICRINISVTSALQKTEQPHSDAGFIALPPDSSRRT